MNRGVKDSSSRQGKKRSGQVLVKPLFNERKEIKTRLFTLIRSNVLLK
jgi:hypothetical protein